MVDFRKCFSSEKQKEMAKVDEYYERKLIEFRNMKTENLLSTAEYFMTQMREPRKHDPTAPVYDSVFWHLIVPEMMRRLKRERD